MKPKRTKGCVYYAHVIYKRDNGSKLRFKPCAYFMEWQKALKYLSNCSNYYYEYMVKMQVVDYKLVAKVVYEK